MNFESDIVNCLQVLKNGGLIVYPTDTIWGIGCDAMNEKAVRRIYDLKKRKDQKSMIILIADEKDLLKYVASPDPEIIKYLENVQKPTTIIYENAIGLPDNLVNEDGSIGIRVVKEIFCKHLIKRFGKPIVSTSANIGGRPAPRFYDDIAGEILMGVDFVVEFRREEITAKEPSAIIKWHSNGTITTIRP